LGYFCKFHKTAQGKEWPKIRDFAQSGHTGGMHELAAWLCAHLEQGCQIFLGARYQNWYVRFENKPFGNPDLEWFSSTCRPLFALTQKKRKILSDGPSGQVRNLRTLSQRVPNKIYISDLCQNVTEAEKTKRT
jgi:hypothetical protein